MATDPVNDVSPPLLPLPADAQIHLGSHAYTLIVGAPDQPNTLPGTHGDDLIIGGDAGNFIFGGSGNDILIGGAGNDTIQGSFGHDIIYAGPGDNVVNGLGVTDPPGGHPPPWPYYKPEGDTFVFAFDSVHPIPVGTTRIGDLNPNDHLVFVDLANQTTDPAALDKLVTVTGQGQAFQIEWKDGSGGISATLNNGTGHEADQYASMQDVAAHFHTDFLHLLTGNSPDYWFGSSS